MTLSRRDFLAGVTAAGAQTALFGSSALAKKGGNGGGNGGGGGGGGETPAGTIYFWGGETPETGGIWAMKGDGSDKQFVVPWALIDDPDDGQLGFSPSKRIYGPDTYFDRWWLSLARNPDRVYDWVFNADGTVRAQNALYWDVVAVRFAPDMSYEVLQMTDLFKNIQPSIDRFPEWGTDGTDLWFTFRGQNVTQSFVEDPDTGEVSLYHPYPPARNYLVNYSMLDLLNGEPPVADINDPRIIELPTEGNDTIEFDMAPTKDAFVYHPGAWFERTNMLVVHDGVSGQEHTLFQHEKLGGPFRFRWSPAGDRIVHTGTNTAPVPSGIFLSDPFAGMNATPLLTDFTARNSSTTYWDARFSPDGQFIMFETTTVKPSLRKEHNMGVVGIDGNGLRLITTELDQSNIKWLHTWVSDEFAL